MEYITAVQTVLNFFRNKNKRIITTAEIKSELDFIAGGAKKYVRKMVKEGLLDVGTSYYIRNDNVFKLLHGFKVYISRIHADTLITISLEEWLTYVSNDAEMHHEGFAEATNPIDEHVKIVQKGISIWTTHPFGHNVWFFCSKDRVIVKNPDQETIIKMFKIAAVLDAIVIDENGYIYGKDGLR